MELNLTNYSEPLVTTIAYPFQDFYRFSKFLEKLFRCQVFGLAFLSIGNTTTHI